MAKPRAETEKFLKAIKRNLVDGAQDWRLSCRDEEVVAYLSSLQDKKIAKVVSDPYWNRYPTWRYGRRLGKETDHLAGHYGLIVANVCRIISIAHPDVFDLMCKKSSGLFALCCIDFSSGEKRIKLAKRVYKNKDSRVRLRASKVLPVSFLKKMASDPYQSVRSQVQRRLGMDNCYELFLDDKSPWLKRDAIECAPIESIDYKAIIDDYRKASKDYNDSTMGWKPSVALEAVIPVLLAKIPKEDLPYYLDLSNATTSSWWRSKIEEVMKQRMSV